MHAMRRHSRFGLFSLVLFLGSLAGAARAADAFTDPAKAGPDFVVQGEYKGSLKLDNKDTAAGAQIVAMGDGQFDGALFIGGLPGDGWKRGDKQEKFQGKTEAAATTFKGADWTAKLADGAITVTNSGGASLGTLKKVERKSSTLGAKPPEGAIVLFDGKNADQWQDGKIVENDLLLAGTVSKQEFQDFTLHIEFRAPFVPKERGQGRGNSGVYLQNRYEVQVLDSFGLEGADNECGAVYSIKAPAVNMCYPPLAWQTYDVNFTGARFDGDKKVKNARVTLKHNGVVIHDDYELPKLTPGGDPDEKPGRGRFQLQAHGNPVVYRNIWVVEKK